jgi:hypothetical protein
LLHAVMMLTERLATASNPARNSFDVVIVVRAPARRTRPNAGKRPKVPESLKALSHAVGTARRG